MVLGAVSILHGVAAWLDAVETAAGERGVGGGEDRPQAHHLEARDAIGAKDEPQLEGPESAAQGQLPVLPHLGDHTSRSRHDRAQIGLGVRSARLNQEPI